ncbi:MAG TPA: hypothetical protein VMF89_24430 [Polyangiales bacterium]|nr:hypothetical protein [Polyangiales bacterium]
MRSAYLVLPCWLLAAAAGCSSDHDALEKRLNGLRDDISHLQADNDRLTERIDGLEAKGREPSKAANTPAEPARPNLRVVKLSPDNAVAQVGSEVSPEDRPDAPGNRPVIRVRGQKEGRNSDEPRSAISVRPAAEDKP